MKNINNNIYLYLLILGLTITLGVFFVYSALFAVGSLKDINPTGSMEKYVISLILGTFGGLTGFLLAKLFVREKLIMYSLYGLLIGLLSFVHLSEPIAGVKRWINIGAFQFQPSELSKLILPLFLVFYYNRIKNKNSFIYEIIIPIIISAIPLYLIFIGPDLSTTFIVSVISFSAIVLSIKKASNLRLFLLLTIIIFIAFFIMQDLFLEAYQKERFISSDTYQTNQSLRAIRSGGLIGTSPFSGQLKYQVPESYSDFIIAVIGEEWGRIGIILVITLFFFNSRELIKMSYYSKDKLTFVYCSVTAIWIFLQTAINALVGLGVRWIPVTGVTLPLMSYGNSSLMVTLTTIGICLGLIYHSYLENFQNIENNKD